MNAVEPRLGVSIAALVAMLAAGIGCAARETACASAVPARRHTMRAAVWPRLLARKQARFAARRWSAPEPW
jgi:hypothetical protein